MNAQTKIEATIASAYVAAFAEIEGATKAASGQVGQNKYKYADLTAVIGVIRPVLARNNLAFTQPCEPSIEGVTVRTVLHHVSGDTMDLGSLFVPANKRDPQGFGSALTYARRYALVSAFGVPTEDDDGNAAVKSMEGGQSQTGAVSPQPLTEAQFSEIAALMERAGVEAEKICTAYQVDAVKALPGTLFDTVKKRLETTIEKKEGA